MFNWFSDKFYSKQPTKNEVYIDGSCKNQGLPNARAGYGVHHGDGDPRNRCGRVPGFQDNNNAELFAAREAIKQASRKKEKYLIINTDSYYVLDAIQNSHNFKSASGDKRRLMESINDLKKNVKVTPKYVKAHSGNHGNNQAHLLAKAGASGKRM